jgi:hypothetical protein
MTLVINRPCGTCAHAVVCRIREGLEAALNDSTQLVVPYADPALEYDVSVDVSCAHFLEKRSPLATPAQAELVRALVAARDVSEEPPNIPDFIPEPAAPPEPATIIPLTVDRLRAAGLAPAQLVTRGAPNPQRVAAGKARALGAARVKCDPGCGGMFYDGPGIAAHKRHCSAYQAHHDAHVVDVAPRPGAMAAAPLPGGEDALAARQADDEKYRARAAGKVEENWQRRRGQA